MELECLNVGRYNLICNAKKMYFSKHTEFEFTAFGSKGKAFIGIRNTKFIIFIPILLPCLK